MAEPYVPGEGIESPLPLRTFTRRGRGRGISRLVRSATFRGSTTHVETPKLRQSGIESEGPSLLFRGPRPAVLERETVGSSLGARA